MDVIEGTMTEHGNELIAALIERLHKATGPDRTIDFDIAYAINWRYDMEPDCTWREYADKFPRLARKDNFPRYTESLDAAWSLMPEGAVGFIGNDFELPGNAHINNTFRNFSGHGANPAIAFCIAAFGARK